jgi:class 3 adenylate cyclase
MSDVRRGILVLADITGYTRYLTGVELEHSRDALADLLGIVAGELSAIGGITKFEGDAVFVCDPSETTDADTLLASLDASYFAFARRRRTIEVRTTCTCEACARIPDLDLKLIAHHGSFAEQRIGGSSEVVGADVIVAHRLLKNHVAETTGVPAFALITDACCGALGIDPEAMRLIPHTEQFADVGAVPGWVRDLGARWAEAAGRDQVRISAEDADFSFSRSFRAPPSAVWEAIVAPTKQLQWKVGVTDVQVDNPTGTPDVGSTTHCVHGRQAFDQEILDWRPFQYFSHREVGPYGPFLWTFELTDGDQTELEVRVKLLGGVRQRAIMLVGRRKLRQIMETGLARMAGLLEADR